MHEDHVVALHGELGTAHLLRLAAYQRLGGALLIEPELSELGFRICVATALMMSPS
jgi:hypothetical protein